MASHPPEASLAWCPGTVAPRQTIGEHIRTLRQVGTPYYPEVSDRCWIYQSPLGLALEHREEAGLGLELNRVFDVDLVRFTPCST